MGKLKRFFTFIVITIFFLNGNALNSYAAAPKASIKLSKSSVNLFIGKSITLSYKALNTKNSPVVWTSSNSSVAKVINGKITGIKVGTSIVTVSVPKYKIKSTAKITVIKKALTAKEAFDKVNKSVVYIESFNKYNQPVASGSGFIVSRDGKIATNHHVITDVDEIDHLKIRLSNGIIYETNRVIGYSESKDIAVLKIDGPTDLPVVTLGNSDTVSTGVKVYALGSPKGIQNTITEGIVSNRSVSLDDDSGNVYIQTSAPINHGNSGGILINVYGEVIGINDLIYENAQNMGYAIPINVYKALPQNQNKTVLSVNREYYTPPSGEGDVYEKESNDNLDNANYEGFEKATLYGSYSNMNDTDYYWFMLTDYKYVSIVGSTTDASISQDFAYSLYDGNGNFLKVCEVDWHSDHNQYSCDLGMDLAPGFYHIGVYPNPGTQYNFTGQSYWLSVWLEEQN